MLKKIRRCWKNARIIKKYWKLLWNHWRKLLEIIKITENHWKPLKTIGVGCPPQTSLFLIETGAFRLNLGTTFSLPFSKSPFSQSLLPHLICAWRNFLSLLFITSWFSFSLHFFSLDYYFLSCFLDKISSLLYPALYFTSILL